MGDNMEEQVNLADLVELFEMAGHVVQVGGA